jgi:hypothetical protein
MNVRKYLLLLGTLCVWLSGFDRALARSKGGSPLGFEQSKIYNLLQELRARHTNQLPATLEGISVGTNDVLGLWWDSEVYRTNIASAYHYWGTNGPVVRGRRIVVMAKRPYRHGPSTREPERMFAYTTADDSGFRVSRQTERAILENAVLREAGVRPEPPVIDPPNYVFIERSVISGLVALAGGALFAGGWWLRRSFLPGLQAARHDPAAGRASPPWERHAGVISVSLVVFPLLGMIVLLKSPRVNSQLIGQLVVALIYACWLMAAYVPLGGLRCGSVLNRVLSLVGLLLGWAAVVFAVWSYWAANS